MKHFHAAAFRAHNVAMLLVLCTIWIPGQLRAEEVEVSAGQFLSFDKPAGFEVGVSRDPDDEFRPKLKLSHFAKSGIKDFGFKVSIHTANRETLRDERMAIALMSDLCGRLDAGSAEGTVPIRNYRGTTDVWYCYATDAKLKNSSALLPGTYRNVSVAFSRHEEHGFTAIAYSQSISDSLFHDFLHTMSTLTARESAPNRR